MNKPSPEFESLLPPLVLNRRGFLTTSVMSGFADAAGPVMAQTAIKTDDKGLIAGQVQIQDICRRLAKLGYLAIATDLYSRQGDPSKYTEMGKIFAEIVSKVPDAQVMSDLDATVKWAVANGGNANRLGLTGFCWGGRIAWLYSAHNPKLKASVAWYGRLVGDKDELHPTNPIYLTGKLHAPVLGLYGGQDTGIPVASMNLMKAALETGDAAAKASEFVLYPHVGHAFHADYRPSYHETEAKDGWVKMQAWFKQYV